MSFDYQKIRIQNSWFPDYIISDASRENDVEKVKFLLKQHDIDPSVNKNCSIRLASRYGHSKIVKILLNDPRVSLSDYEGEAIRNASKNGHLKVVKLITISQIKFNKKLKN